MEEKRKASRIEKAIVVQYSICIDGNPCWDSSTIKNISADGILLHTDKNFEKGQLLELRFKLPADPLNWLIAKGQVVESSHCKTRIRFIDLGESQKKIIDEYIGWFVKNNPSVKP